jgi:hypothetical protein
MPKNGLAIFIIIAVFGLLLTDGWEQLKKATGESEANNRVTKRSDVDTSGLQGRDQSRGRAVLITARRYRGPGESEPIRITRDKPGCQVSRSPVVVPLSWDKYPASAWHIKLAWRRGAPRVWHLDRPNADANRAASLRGIESDDQLDRDEVPLASTREGGRGADIAYIPYADNRGSGSYIGNYMSDYCNGQAFRIKITK